MPTSTPETSPTKGSGYELQDLKDRKVDFDDLARRRTTMSSRFDSEAPLRKDKQATSSEEGGPQTGRPTERGFIDNKGSTQSFDEEEGRDVVLPDQVGRDQKKNPPTTPRGQIKLNYTSSVGERSADIIPNETPKIEIRHQRSGSTVPMS